MAKYEQQVSKINESNLDAQRLLYAWDEEGNKLSAALQKEKDKQNQLKTSYEKLKSEVEALENIQKPDVPREPKTSLDPNLLPELKSELHQLMANIQQAANQKNQREFSQNRIGEFKAEYEKAQKRFKFYMMMESTFKKVPGYELQKIKNAMTIPGYDLLLIEEDGEAIGIEYALNGIAWPGLSKGEKKKLSCLISKKLSELRKRPNGEPILQFFFVDDQELLDSDDAIKTLPGQRILAKVDQKGWMVV